jgi:hypothetical protein
MHLARVTVAMIGLAACGGRADSAAARTNLRADPVPTPSAVSDTTALVLIDLPTVIGYFPPAADSTEAEEDGYSEGVAHVGFALQDAEYRAAVLGTAPRVGVEAGLSMGWERWLGERSLFVGMTGFGASAPAEKLFEHFGITPAAIVAAARKLVGQD